MQAGSAPRAKPATRRGAKSQRLRYEGEGKWFNVATGTALDKAPTHRNVISLPSE